MARYKLLAAANIDGLRYKQGDVIVQPDDWRGPMKTVPKLDDNKQPIFDKGIRQVVDEPLFELIKEKEDHHG